MFIKFMSVLLVIHAIGHLQGVLSANSKIGSAHWNLNSQIVSAYMTEANSQITGMSLYLVATISSIFCSLNILGVIYSAADWRFLALISAFASFSAIILYPNGLLGLFNKTAAIGLNISILVLYYILENGFQVIL